MSCIDLISLKIQIVGGNLFKNPGFKSSLLVAELDFSIEREFKTEVFCEQICIGKKLLQFKTRFFKNHELYWSNFPQNSNCGRELVQKSGVQISVAEGQIFLSCFLFIFTFSIKKLNVDKILFFIFFYQMNINTNRYIEQILLFFFLCNLLCKKRSLL